VSAMVSVAGRLADRSGKDGEGPLDDLLRVPLLGDCYG
jgi:hypothetical protein